MKCSRCPNEALPNQRYCAEDRRLYDNARYHKQRAEYIELLGGKCVVCGTLANLELDHIDSATKTFDIGKLWTKPKAVILIEIQKCQLLCKFHHTEKTEAAGDLGQVPHGGGKRGKHRCKCVLCRAKVAEYMREYRKTKSKP